MHEEKDNPFISVVICSYSLDRFDMTISCIRSILANTYRNFEIILAIDGNKKLKQKMLTEFGKTDKISVVGNEEDGGISISRNRCIEFAKGSIIAFIDDDAFATPNWLELIAKDFSENPYILALGGKSIPIYENGSNKLPEEILWIVGSTYKGHPEHKQPVRNVFTCNMAVKKEIFEKINFEIIYENHKNSYIRPIKQLEDTLFCMRLNNIKANSVLYDPEIIIHHNVPRQRLTFKYIFSRTFSEGILKARIEHIADNGRCNLDHERNYLTMLLITIINKLCKLRIRDVALLSLTIFGVGLGYVGYILQRKREIYTVGDNEDTKDVKLYEIS